MHLKLLNDIRLHIESVNVAKPEQSPILSVHRVLRTTMSYGTDVSSG